eukprot:CCRYP_005050-RA/>CCRYP_005050-RA protein AED:0.04 eAED:0.04 QI:77/0.66/0.5/1/0.66/0.5/4/722/760
MVPRPSSLPLALLIVLWCPANGFGPASPLLTSQGGHHAHLHQQSLALSSERQVGNNKKRRFLQQAHPIAPTKTNRVGQGDATNPAAAPATRILKPPLQTSKSIEELEAILERRWGTATGKTTRSEDADLVLSFEDETDTRAKKGAAVRRSRRVVDPWEREEVQTSSGDDDDETETSSGGKTNRKGDPKEEEGKYSRDEVMLNRVRANQARLLSRKEKTPKRSGRDENVYDGPIENKDDYDQNGEGYETSDPGVRSILSPRPVGGKGKMSAASSISGGIFSTATSIRGVSRPVPTKEATNPKTDEEKKKPRRKEPQSEPMLDEDGKPMYLTLEQAERIVEKILSSEDNGPKTDSGTSRNFDSDTIEWQDIGITDQQLLENLQSNNMVCPTPLQVQIKACPPIIAGNDVLLSTHTGSGKTLAFLTPIAQNIMIHPSNSSLPKAIIVAPGRELASQIVSVAQNLFEGTGLTVALAIGGTSYARNVEMLRSKKPDVVVGTPGRIAELILGRTGDKGGKLKISALQTIVLDEFDALLQYDAHKEPTNAIMEAIERQHGKSLQRVANIDESDLLVTSGVKTNSNEGKMATTARVSRTTIHGTLHVPHQRLALDAVRRVLNTDPVIQQALIFVDSPRRVDIVIEKLAEMDIIAAPLHGGATSAKGDRAEVSKALREGFVGVVVATEMAARGLDAPYLTHVINLDLPTDASHYAHRSGRCGRGGRPGVAISITCNERERGVPKRFAKELGITMHQVEAREGKLRIVNP